jgi:hypothetical protein
MRSRTACPESPTSRWTASPNRSGSFAHVTDDHIRMLAAGWRPLAALPEIEDDAA